MFDHIEHVVYINLEHRKDRKEQIEKELSVFGEKVQRFDAIHEPGRGHLGCSKSHIEVLKLAIQSGWKNYLVVEDDVVLDLTGYPILEDLITRPYDVILLGGTALSFDKTYRCYNSCCTTAYLVHQSYYQTLLTNFEEGVQKLEKNYSKSDFYAIDQYWNPLQRSDNWYIVYPTLASQRSDYSDITGQLIDKIESSKYDILTMNPRWITVHLQGGLGNQLFQLAFLLYVRKLTGNHIFVDSLQTPEAHSTENYFDTLFSTWKPYYSNKPTTLLCENPKLAYEDWKPKIDNTEGDIKLSGYFQRENYTQCVNQEFFDSLTFDETVLQKYPDISSKFFIHVRGGDYIGNSLHFVDLKQYYKECMNKHFGEKFVIFTNDIPYARSLFNEIPIIEESEVDTLLLMSRAKGCICANSSFSWWGAYLNPKRPICFPSKWFNDLLMDTSGFYFEDVHIQNDFTYFIPKLQPPPKFPVVPVPKPKVPPDFRRQIPSLNFLRRK
jgi:GR25 family glycosyltransferase involved in LPS biosynthesis